MIVRLLQVPSFSRPLSLIRRIINAFRKKSVFSVASVFIILGSFPSYGQACFPLTAAIGYERGTAIRDQFTSAHTSITMPQKLADDQRKTSLVSVSIYPNPTTRDFALHMQSSNAEINSCMIEVRNLLGQVIISEEAAIADGHLYYEVSLKDQQPNGIYMISIIADGSRFNEQLVIHNN